MYRLSQPQFFYKSILLILHTDLALTSTGVYDSLGSMHRHTARSLNSLGELYCVQERYGEAEPLLRRALHILEVSLGPTHAEVAAILENLARLLRNTAREAEAQELEERAKSIRNG